MSAHITIRPAEGTWVVRAGGAVLGESSRALELVEGDYPPVIYFPREDIAMAFLEPSKTRSHCPWKGDALIANLKEQNIVRVKMDGTKATEAARYDFGKRLREIVQGPDGALFILEDGDGGRLRKLTPAV